MYKELKQLSNVLESFAKFYSGQDEPKSLVVKKNKKIKKVGLIDNEKYFWSKQIEIEEKQEKKMILQLRKLFKDQEKAVKKRLEEITKGVEARTIRDEYRFKKYWYEMKINIPALLLSIKKETRKFYLVLKPILKDTTTEVGSYVLEEMGIDIEFSDNEVIRKYLDKNTIKFSKEVNVKTNKQIRATLTEGIMAKEGIYELTKRIEAVFSGAKGYRANMIARTETARVANFATTEAYRQSGVVKGKEWLTAFDERTCEWCVPMNGKIVSLERDFFKEGDTFIGNEGEILELDYENVGFPPLHPNCRCTLIPVLEEIKNIKNADPDSSPEIKVVSVINIKK